MGRQADRLAGMEAVELLERDRAVAGVVQQGDLLGEVVGRDRVERVGLARELARGRRSRGTGAPGCCVRELAAALQTSRSSAVSSTAGAAMRTARSAAGAAALPGAAASSPHAAPSSAMAARMAVRTGAQREHCHR